MFKHSFFVFTFILTFMFSAFAHAGSVPPASKITSDEVSAIPYWVGEYPSPIIQIDMNVTLDAIKANGKDLKKDLVANKPVKCKLKPGLYHPWAKWPKGKDPALGFYTLIETETYEAIKPVKLYLEDKTLDLKGGDKVFVYNYLSEGNCMMGTVVGGKLLKGGGECPAEENFKNLSVKDAKVNIQYMLASCSGGSTVWILVDDALLKTSGITQGENVGYGSVRATKSTDKSSKKGKRK